MNTTSRRTLRIPQERTILGKCFATTIITRAIMEEGIRGAGIFTDDIGILNAMLRQS